MSNNILEPNIVSYSGGKDSTAMLIKLVENKVHIDDILYVDMGKWIWNEVKEHNKQVEDILGVTITTLKPIENMEEEFIKYGFPSPSNRWCTGIKNNTMFKYINKKYPKIMKTYNIGYCSNETERYNNNLGKFYKVKYPLVEYGITNDDALELCYNYGFDFGGLYENHSHINCWLCPLQRNSELEWLYNNDIDKWNYLIKLQRLTYGTFNNNHTIYDIEKKFWLNNHDRLKEISRDKRKNKWLNKFKEAKERGERNKSL